MNIRKILKYTGITVLALAALGAIGLGMLNGVKAAQSRQISKDAKAIIAGLEYFYKDQNRYPFVGEFEDQNVMRQYVSGFPPREFPSELCEKSYDYVNNFRNDYELRICLPKGVSGYKAGWNVIKSPVK